MYFRSKIKTKLVTKEITLFQATTETVNSKCSTEQVGLAILSTSVTL